jgi:excisionase family DNA binding protein
MFKEKGLQDYFLQINTLLNAKDVAKILQISRSMTYDLMQRGEIPTVRVGKCRRVQPEDLVKYVESNIYSLNHYFE